jgi:hypothetical protein
MISKEGFVLRRVGEKENQQRYTIAKFTNTPTQETCFFSLIKKKKKDKNKIQRETRRVKNVYGSFILLIYVNKWIVQHEIERMN